jgi:hypothetical protein
MVPNYIQIRGLEGALDKAIEAGIRRALGKDNDRRTLPGLASFLWTNEMKRYKKKCAP